MTDLHTAEITKNVVPDNERMDFLPMLFGREYFWGELHAFATMDRFVDNYQGGYWEFYRLSCGGGYMAPDMARVSMCIPENWFDDEMSGDAAGIVITIYTLNRLMWRLDGRGRDDLMEPLIKHYDLLRDYASQHPEAGKIYRAID